MICSVSTYSFSALMAAGETTQLGCLTLAKEMGFEAVEIVDLHPHDGSSPAEYAARLGEECRRLGLAVSNWTFGADFLSGSGGDVSAEIARVKGMIDLAQPLGAGSVRHDATRGYAPGDRRGFEDALPVLADACRQVTRYAAAQGVRTMVENHGTFCQESARMERLVQAVGDGNFGWLCDIGNFLCADEGPAAAVGRAAPFARYVHAKDFHRRSGMLPEPGAGFFRTRGGDYLRGAILGHGDVPVLQCFHALKAAGYDGVIAVEFEGMEDPRKALPICLENLRRLWQRS